MTYDVVDQEKDSEGYGDPCTGNPDKVMVPGRIEDITRHGTETGRWSACPGLRTHTVYPKKYLVVTGDLDEGFTFYGPFTEDKLAARWAYNNIKREIDHRVLILNEVRS